MEQQVKEILFEQLQLLKQESRKDNADLAAISHAMVEIASQLSFLL